MPLELDVTSTENIKNVVEEAINKYKRPPSVIVNCAGITRDAFILKMEENDFDLVLNVNLKVSFPYHQTCETAMPIHCSLFFRVLFSL